MPRTTNAEFKDQKNSATNQPIYLYTIDDYDGSSNDLNFAEYDTDITYDGITYTRFPISHETISGNTEGSIDTVVVSVSNISRLIESYLEDYDLRGKKVTIKTVWANKLADASAYMDDIFYIDKYTASQDAVSFTLTSKFDLLSVQIPSRKYSRNYCSWVFKSTECGYAGGETTCSKTKQRCKVLANYTRFGGFPSIPTGRIYVS